MQSSDGLQGGDPLLRGLADADEDAAREGDVELAGGADRLQAPGGSLGRGAGVYGLHETLGDRLEHQALGGGDLAQAGQVLTREHAKVGVRE